MLLLIRLRVRDYAKWKPIFDERQSIRVQRGGKRHWLYRSADDSNELVVSVEFPNANAARAYATDPSLREAMARAGVQGEPSFMYLEEVEDKRY